jgi:menaquinone-dependent protoporphyrinogen oxidase
MESAHVLIGYETQEGQSAVIARRLGEHLEQAGFGVDVSAVADAPRGLEGYDAVMLGGSVHVGKHGKALVAYAKAHAPELKSRPSGFFSVSLTAVKRDDEHLATAASLVDDFVRDTGWEPEVVGLIGGALRYRQYNPVKRQLLRLISKKEGGPTETSRDWELTDWSEVSEFADRFAAVVSARGQETP